MIDPRTLLVFMSALVLFGRFFVPGHDLTWAGSYEAAAHIWVGVLIALGCVRGQHDRRLCWEMLGVLSMVEVVMFLMR